MSAVCTTPVCMMQAPVSKSNRLMSLCSATRSFTTRLCTTRSLTTKAARISLCPQRHQLFVARGQQNGKDVDIQAEDEDKANANKFRNAVQSQFGGVDGVKISTISPEAVGPHPMPEFELAFTKYCLEDILPWLVFNRPDGYSILVHPFTSDVVADHDSSAMWLGKNLGADLQPLKDLQQQIKDEVKAGKDEDALLWPFVYAEINDQSDLQ